MIWSAFRAVAPRAVVLALLATLVPPPPATAAIAPAAATLPDVAMSCRSGQVDINHASIQDLMEYLSVDTPTAQRIVGFRPFLAPRDLLVVEGIGPERLAALLSADVACATPTQLPPPSAEACVDNTKIDLQVATVDQVARGLSLSKSVAKRLVQQRPYATRRHITPERVAGLGKGQLPGLLSKSCLTPAPVQIDSSAWRWAYRSLTTNVQRGAFALQVAPGVLDGFGAWLSITDVATPPTAVTGPAADFHVWGPWADGAQAVRVTVPADQLPFADPANEWSPVAIHFPLSGEPELITGAALSINTAAGTLSYNLTSLSTSQSAFMPRGWLVPFTHFTAPVPRHSVLEELARAFTGLRASTPSCAPDITNDQLVTTGGDAIEVHLPFGDVPLKHCVEKGDGAGLWKLANNTGTVISFNSQQQARFVDLLPAGDLATQLVFDVWNDTTDGPTVRAKADIPPGATAILRLPQGVSGDEVGVGMNEVLSVAAFALRQIGSLLPTEARILYNTLNSCGFAPFSNSDNFVPEKLLIVLDCTLAALEPVGFEALVKRVGSIRFFGDSLLSLKDLLSVDLGGGMSLNLTYRNPPANPPGLPGGGGGGGNHPDGTFSGLGPVDRPALWRLDSGGERGQPYLVVDSTASTTLDQERVRCLSRHYVLRDFYAGNVLDVWTQESKDPALCPSDAPELDLPAGSTNWVLREESGAAWFVNGSSQLERIGDGGQYMACAQRYLVLDYARAEMVERFGMRATAPPASCG